LCLKPEGVDTKKKAEFRGAVQKDWTVTGQGSTNTRVEVSHLGFKRKKGARGGNYGILAIIWQFHLKK